jgi:hypothetical protein
MARSKINAIREVKYEGMTHTIRIEEVVDVCIPDLELKPEFSVDGDDILLSCGNPAAAEEVERVFPSEEWAYSYRTSKRTVGYDSKWKNRKQNPYFFIRVENRAFPIVSDAETGMAKGFNSDFCHGFLPL